MTVPTGTGLLKLSLKLKEDGIIRSSTGFRTAAILFGGEHGLQAGDYYLPRPENAFVIAWRIVSGSRGLAQVRITIPEGYTASEIADLFDGRFPRFNHEEFLTYAKEGYMFPDTYFIEISATASSTIDMLKNNYEKKVSLLRDDISVSGHTEREIITLASILESEAKNKEDKEIIAGILLKRIKLGMALQVDASLTYITGKTSAELTVSDLASNSPFNTYKHPGLPPTPISNPGLESIEAAIYPKDSPYLYFLTGHDGKMYYARTFDEHKQNRQKYLK